MKEFGAYARLIKYYKGRTFINTRGQDHQDGITGQQTSNSRRKVEGRGVGEGVVSSMPCAGWGRQQSFWNYQD